MGRKFKIQRVANITAPGVGSGWGRNDTLDLPGFGGEQLAHFLGPSLASTLSRNTPG